MRRSAEISPCGLYRWSLTRDWSDEEKLLVREPEMCLFVGLNPSIADAIIDDQTVKVWISFAKSWGYSGFTALNLNPFRAQNPDCLIDTEVPQEIFDENMQRLAIASRHFGPLSTIVCWGANKWVAQTGIDRVVMTEVLEGTPMCFGVTKFGYPKHPLRQPLRLQLQPYRLPACRRSHG